MIRRCLVALTISVLGAFVLGAQGPLTAGQGAPPPAAPLRGQTSTRLPNGRLLVTGGDSLAGPVATMTLIDPVSRQTITLPARLLEPRAGHTATLMPDGTVLIVGGRGASGEALATAERFDPAIEVSTPVVMPGAAPRAGHTATLLTDGQVLLVGGEGPNAQQVAPTQLWNVDTLSALPVLGGRLHRSGHAATLQGDGTVAIVDARETSSAQPAAVDRFDPRSRTIQSGREAPRAETALVVRDARPASGTADVPVDAVLTLRLSHAADPDTLTDQTVAVVGPQGPATVLVVPAEGGRLVFVRPLSPLDADAEYRVTLNGVQDAAGTPVAAGRWTFRTTAERPVAFGDDSESWVPDAASIAKGWKTNLPPSPYQRLPALHAEPGVTALAGQVLLIDGRPLRGVTLVIDQDRTETDSTGRFLLRVPSAGAGRHELEIDGTTANRAGRKYGFFEYGLSLTPGDTTVLPFTIWMPRLDTRHEVELASPTTRETVVTTPYVPGLELHLPPGTTIRGHDGITVRRVGLTPIPVDRPPFPLARNVDVPVYFTAQPGGAYVHTPYGTGPRGAWLVYPNYRKAEPGQRAQFFHYDPRVRDWYVYGLGTISRDGKQGIPDPTTRFYAFTGAMFQTGYSPPGLGQTPGGPSVGDPVDPSTGVFVAHKTDLHLPDVIPLALTRTYNSGDNIARPFGRGMTHPYMMFLWSALQYQEVDLILPDGGRIHYVRTSAGTGWVDAVFVHQETATTSATPTPFYKSVITWNGNGWDLTLKDGTVYVFGENAPLQEIRDRYGNTVTITHASGQTGNVTKVTSPNGRWITFTYDGNNRISQVTDNINRTVSYTYDGNGNLSTVTDPENGVTTYTYTAGNQVATIKDARNIVYLTNQYQNGRVSQQTLAEPGETYQFAYTVNGSGSVTQTDVTNPRGYVERLTFNADHYVVSDTEALGQSVARTSTIERQTGSNLVMATVDGLNRRTEFTYDASGHVLTQTRLAGTPQAVTTTFTYEPRFFQLATITDPLNHTWTTIYDSGGKVTGTSNPLGESITVVMNAAGQVTGVTDALSHQWQLGYTQGDLTSTTNPLGAATTRFVDAAGRVLRVTDPLGRQTRTAYDKLNRATSVTDAQGGVTAFAYDGNSNLLSVTDALTHTTSYAYNTSDRVQTRTDPLTHAESSAYDAFGNRTQHTDRKGQVTGSTYDALNRVSVVTYDDDSTVTYTYDAGDHITQIADSANGTLTRQYDGLDRLTQESTPEGIVSYTYDTAGRRTSMTVAGQTPVSYGYDTANRLTSITRGSAVTAITYDAAGRRSTLTYPNGIVQSSTYDVANQLTSLAYTLNSNSIGDLAYSYDLSGQRTSVGGSWARTGMPPALASATYNAANQLTAWGGTSFSLDLNGNLTSDGLTSYAWNTRDQLTALSGGTSAGFAYDAKGRRRSKTVSGTTTGFLYDGWNLVQELTGGGTPTANLLTGLDIDETFTRTDGAGTSTLLVDALGSTLELANASGVLQTHYTYEPFGATTVSGAASTSAAQFTGRENDGTGLYFYRARYYAPSIGRFLSEDPLKCQRDAGVDLYTYVGNDPLDLKDPSGLAPGVGPGACRYYDERCRYSQGRGGDPYACRAGECCRDFGDSADGNCTRRCLIEADSTCATLPINNPIIGSDVIPTRSGCRLNAHVVCYLSCGFWPRSVPRSCVGVAMGF